MFYGIDLEQSQEVVFYSSEQKKLTDITKQISVFFLFRRTNEHRIKEFGALPNRPLV